VARIIFGLGLYSFYCWWLSKSSI